MSLRTGAGRAARAVGPRATLAATVVAAAVLVACGGGGSDDAAEPEGASTTTTPSGPSTTDPPEATRALVIGHRGASGYAPEHTFAAYDLALEQGADVIEQDLQLTADGELVVLHDETLDRTARGPAEACTGLVRERTLAEIEQCDVGTWFNEENPDLADPAFVGLRIPTMREVFERYGPEVRYYVETKAPESQPGLEDALLDLMDEVGITEAAIADRQVLVQSFSPDSLRLVHEREPGLPLVQLLVISGEPIPTSALDAAAEIAIGVGPADANVDAALVEAAHALCLDVHPYTVDDPDRMAALLDLGVDGMFTNVPDVLVAARAEADPPPAPCS